MIYRVARVFTAIRSNLQSSPRIYSDLPQICKVACVFIANRRKSPQTAEIATYAGFADPNFRLQQRAQIFFPNVPYLYLGLIYIYKKDIYLTKLPKFKYNFYNYLPIATALSFK